MGLFLTIIFCALNYMRARVKKLNAAKWAFFTFLATLVGWFVGGMIMMIILMVRFPDLVELTTQPDASPATLAPAIAERMNPWIAEIFLLFCGLGGYLFIRHLLIKKPVPPDDTTFPEGM
jgi:hypothetical protein